MTTTFDEIIEATRNGELSDRQARIHAINRAIDEYVAIEGKAPDSDVLERLADAILHEELTDKHPDKITREQYPFMSDWQLSLRYESEYSDKLAENIGADGKNHEPPTRRHRTKRENFTVDKYAKARNKERRAKYREFTKVQPVISYFKDVTNE